MKWIALFLLTLCITVSSISVTITTITYIGAFIFLLLSCGWNTCFKKIVENKAALSFWLLGALFVAGTFYSTSTRHLIFQDLQKQHWLFMTPFFIVFIAEEVWRKRMVNAFLWAMIGVLLLSYFKVFLHNEFVTIMSPIKIYPAGSVFMDRIVQSFAMNIAAFICGYRCLFEKENRLFYAIIFLLMGVNIIFMSDGRTGYGIFFLLLCYLGLIRFKWTGVFFAAFSGMIIIACAFFFSPHFQSRIKDMVHHYQYSHQINHRTSIGQRLEMWHIAKKMIHERPWIGYGTGGIRTALPDVVSPQEHKYTPSLDYVESIYLNFMLEFGVVGLIVLLTAIFMQFKTTFELPKHYRCLMQFVLIATFFGGLFNAFLVSFPIAHMYALFAALCFSAKQSSGVAHDQ